MDDEQSAPDATHPLAVISGEMTRLYKEQFGRGPTRVRTDYANADTLVVVLEGTLTPAERSLAALGEHQRLRDMRLFFQYATIVGFCDPVEQITGRRVRAFVSGMDTVADVATELFMLHPAGVEVPSRSLL